MRIATNTTIRSQRREAQVSKAAPSIFNHQETIP
jgi:hypothetical protein